MKLDNYRNQHIWGEYNQTFKNCEFFRNVVTQKSSKKCLSHTDLDNRKHIKNQSISFISGYFRGRQVLCVFFNFLVLSWMW